MGHAVDGATSRSYDAKTEECNSSAGNRHEVRSIHSSRSSVHPLVCFHSDSLRLQRRLLRHGTL